MYTIHDYGDMIADRGRVDAYAAALTRAISPSSVVLDIGAGAGVMAIIACRAGARRVYAVEPDGVIEVARQTVAEHGLSDRVTCIQARSTRVDLPERADVLVADIRGALPWYADSVAAIIDARDRLLKPGGVVIPARDTVWGAVVEATSDFEALVCPWEPELGTPSAAGRRRALNTMTTRWFGPDALLTPPQECMAIDYRDVRSPNACGRLRWTAARAGTAHGLCLWFDCETAPGVSFSNSPVAGERHVYGHAFLPWLEAVALEVGDEIDVTVRADLVGGCYMSAWQTEVRRARHEAAATRFEQSEFFSVPLSADWLKKADASFVPSPNTAAAIDRLILDSIGNGASLGQIAERVSNQFPKRFPDARSALARVAELSLRYTE